MTKARLELEAAQDALEDLTNVTAVDLAKAQSSVADAQLDVEAAQDAVDEATTPAVAEDIADYQADIDSDANSLIGVQFDLQTVERNAEEKTRDATEDLDTALGEYNGVFVKWLGMNIALAVRPVPRGDTWRHIRHRPREYFRGVSHPGDHVPIRGWRV